MINMDNGSVNGSLLGLTEEVSPYSARPETYIVPALFAVIFLVGVLGNGTLVLIFIRHRTMRNVPNTYIISLALGDLLVIVVSVPFTSTVYTFESWPYGETVCKLSETTKDISVGVSVFTLTALSADRFFAIVDPMKKMYSSLGGRGCTGRTAVTATAIWVLAVGCAIPAALGSYVREFKNMNETLFSVCYPFREDWDPKAIVAVRFIIYYALPLTVIGFFYVLMARHLLLSTRNVPGELQGRARQITARKKVARTVLTFVVVFAVCFLPQHAFLLWFYFNPNFNAEYNGFWHTLRIVGFCLSFINSCINPIALYCVSGTFRKHFDRYLLCWRRRRWREGSGRLRYVSSRKCWGESTMQPLHQGTLRTTDHDPAPECTVITSFINGKNNQ